jgi:hypothetical protein
MAGENPLWGTERIRGELLKLGLVVSARSIRRYRRRQPARPPSLAWRTFLHNEIAGIWGGGSARGANLPRRTASSRAFWFMTAMGSTASTSTCGCGGLEFAGSGLR